jgi:hypothetical protein
MKTNRRSFLATLGILSIARPKLSRGMPAPRLVDNAAESASCCVFPRAIYDPRSKPRRHWYLLTRGPAALAPWCKFPIMIFAEDKAKAEIRAFERFKEHTGECKQCRRVLEAFYAEMPRPTPLCTVGRALLLSFSTAAPQALFSR